MKERSRLCPKCKSAERHPSHGWCRSCRNKSTRKYQKKYIIKYKYGISYEDRDAMIKDQGDKCAACEEAIGHSIPRTVNVDHCHNSGLVRGILCSACNISLGLMKEDPNRIRRLALYIERHQTKPPLSLFLPLSLEERKK